MPDRPSGPTGAFTGPGPSDVALEVNGRAVTLRAPPHRTLLDALRDDIGLTGTKKVCDEGTCGACTVLVDGRAVYSCMTLAHTCAGRQVDTIEGLARDGVLHPVQQAFIDHDAFQCGFCTPGQVMSLVGLLRANEEPTAEDVTRAVTGNLCRCGAYPNIVAAGLSPWAWGAPAPTTRPGPRGRGPSQRAEASVERSRRSQRSEKG